MKKFFSLLAIIITVMMVFPACNTSLTNATDVTNEVEDTLNISAVPDTSEESIPQTPTEPVAQPIIPTYKESIKILAIGNSFSVDAMEHLAIILNDAGVKEIVLGNLYIGGCSISTHSSHIENDTADYTFYVNKGKGWGNAKKQKLDTGILYEDWDIITIQQVSQDSGKPETLGELQRLIDHVRATATNKDVKLLWHMTWAYQNDYSSDAKFGAYNNDQQTMYNAITNVVKTKINTNNSIDGFIPSGTAVQNLRSSYLGDTLTRDGFHLTYDVGRYTAALMWFKELTGESLSEITAVPAEYPNVSLYLPVIKEAVDNAYANKLEITQSDYKEDAEAYVDLTAMTDYDKAHLQGLKLDPNNYRVLDLQLTMKAYYYSTSQKYPVAELIKNESNSKEFMATAIFTSETLPAGSVINIANGYKYRIEGWQSMNNYNSESRMDAAAIDFTWSSSIYDKYSYIAFNISRTSGGAVSDSDVMALRIYVPIK